MVGKAGLIVRQESLVGESLQRKAKAKDLTLRVDQPKPSATQAQERKKDRQEFHGKRNQRRNKEMVYRSS